MKKFKQAWVKGDMVARFVVGPLEIDPLDRKLFPCMVTEAATDLR